MAKTSTSQNINLAFYQSIKKAMEDKNQLVLNSVLMSDKILTPEQKFELLKFAIEKKNALFFDYISDLKSKDISEEQKDKLIELMEKRFQYEENKRPLLSMIERLQNINEQLDIRTQPNKAMEIISGRLNKINTKPPVSLPGKGLTGLTQSGIDLKPNRYQANTKTGEQSNYLDPHNTNQQSNMQSSQSQLIPPSYPAPSPPVKGTNLKQTTVKAGLFTNPEQTTVKVGLFTKNLNLLAKGVKNGVLKIKTRKSNLDGYVAKGLNNSHQNSVLLRPVPPKPNILSINDKEINIYEEIKHPSILKKDKVIITNKKVTFDPTLKKDLTGKISPVKNEIISDNTKGANQKNNYLATNNDLLNAPSSTETHINEQKNTVYDNFKETQYAISKLLKPIKPDNKVETLSSKGQVKTQSVVDITSNDKKQLMPVIPKSHIPIVPPMPAEFKTTPPPPPPPPDFLGGNQGDKKIPTNLSAEQKKNSRLNPYSAKDGSQSNFKVTPEELKSATIKLKRVEKSPTKTNRQIM